MLTHKPQASAKYLNSGFTLVEMMVTITILVIVLGFSIPSMSSWINKSQLKAGSQSIQSALRAAQSHAQSQSRIVALSLTNKSITDENITNTHLTNNSTYWAIYTIPIDGSTENARLLQTGSLHNNHKVTATLEDGEAVCFNSLGRLSRQKTNTPLVINCSKNSKITIQHINIKDNPIILEVNSSGKINPSPQK